MSDAAEKKQRSPVERLIVWGLIAVLLIVVFIEYRASQNFNAAQAYLSDAVEKTPTPTLDEVKATVSGASVGPKLKDDLGTEEYELSFFSLFKSDTYKLRVQLLEVPPGEDEPAEGERRIAEVYAPAVAESVRKEHEKFIVTTPHDLPDADDGTGGMDEYDEGDGKGKGKEKDKPKGDNQGEGAGESDSAGEGDSEAKTDSDSESEPDTSEPSSEPEPQSPSDEE